MSRKEDYSGLENALVNAVNRVAENDGYYEIERENVEERTNLKTILIEELKTMYEMIELMQPKSEAEFIAVTLPNLHTRLFNTFLSDKSRK